MEYAEPLSRPFPWRAATLVAAALAALELVVLIVVGAFLLAQPIHHAAAAKAAATPAVHRTVVAPVHQVKVKPHALQARAHLKVLVLNGNGVGGAAAREAAKLRGFGYRISDSRNAQRHDYARSMVMYAPAYAKEGRRLSHDTGIRIVSPVDGLTPRALKGAKLVVLLGN
ncbi:MAG TPA: LytR C-terminal domain-containing protein [Gaiellaceae bacterium]|nr:LytR C-terminal domain-containing protein [Gaiellaceae bacterium]